MLVTLRGLRVKRVKLLFLSLNGAYRHTYPSQVTPSPSSPKGSLSRFNNNSPTSNFWFRKKYSPKSYYFFLFLSYIFHLGWFHSYVLTIISWRSHQLFDLLHYFGHFSRFIQSYVWQRIKFLMVNESEKLIFSTVQPLFICVLFILAIINSRRHVLFETCWLAA